MYTRPVGTERKLDMKKILICACGLAVLAGLAGCGRSAETYGEAVPGVKPIPVRQLLAAPGDYTSAPVVVEGRITRECPTGCWFDLDADGAPLYVELNDSGLAIPQRVGKTVRVVGKVSTESGQIKLSGQGVEIP